MFVRCVMFFLVFFGFVVVQGCVPTVAIQHVPDPVLSEATPFKTTTPVKLESIVVRIPYGFNMGSLAKNMMCVPSYENTWQRERAQVINSEFTQVFTDVLLAAGYNMVGNSDTLFQDAATHQAKFHIGGLVTEIKANVCYPEYTRWTMEESKGEASVTVKWQVYSVLERTIVATIETTGTANVESAEPRGGENAIVQAFGKAVRFLAADPALRRLVDSQQATGLSGDGEKTSSGTVSPSALSIKTAQ